MSQSIQLLNKRIDFWSLVPFIHSLFISVLSVFYSTVAMEVFVSSVGLIFFVCVDFWSTLLHFFFVNVLYLELPQDNITSVSSHMQTWRKHTNTWFVWVRANFIYLYVHCLWMRCRGSEKVAGKQVFEQVDRSWSLSLGGQHLWLIHGHFWPLVAAGNSPNRCKGKREGLVKRREWGGTEQWWKGSIERQGRALHKKTNTKEG